VNSGGKQVTSEDPGLVNILTLERAWPFQGTEEKACLSVDFLLDLRFIPAPGMLHYRSLPPTVVRPLCQVANRRDC
jgi:hypothetical protein